MNVLYHNGNKQGWFSRRVYYDDDNCDGITLESIVDRMNKNESRYRNVTLDLRTIESEVNMHYVDFDSAEDLLSFIERNKLYLYYNETFYMFTLGENVH
jgi:hypothetical protein